jgi:hypothetical protein
MPKKSARKKKSNSAVIKNKKSPQRSPNKRAIKPNRVSRSIGKNIGNATIGTIGAITLFELIQTTRRWKQRSSYFKAAERRAKKLKTQLIVVGAPNAGPSNRVFGANYGCGDICIDLSGCPGCPNNVKIMTGNLQNMLNELNEIDHAPYVIFISYVLEYIPDLKSTIQAIKTASGDDPANIFVVHASPYTLTSRFKYSSPGDPVAINVILSAPPVSNAITWKKL